MAAETSLKKILKEILDRLQVDYKKITVKEDEKNSYSINVESENPSLLIGYHGENIQALQHLLKVLVWKKDEKEQFNILLDIDNYRKRQEENVLNMTDRKIDAVRRTGRKQELPPMSAYFRRKVHVYCTGAGYDDIETLSEGEGDRRHVVIKLK